MIVKDRGMLEAPAMFKSGSKYYIIASGATGWAPNKQTYYTADSILGTWIRGIEADDKYENTNFQNLPEGADGLLSVGDARGSTFGSQSASVFEYKPGKFIYIGDRWHAGAADSTYVWLPLVIDKTTGRLTMQNPATQDPTAYGDGWDANYWDETVDNPLNLASITVNGTAIDGFAGTTLSYTVDTGVWGKVPTVEAKAVNANDVTVTTDVNTERAIITVTSKADKSKTRVYRVTFSSTTEGSTAVSDPWKTTSWGNASAFAQGADGTNLLRITDKSNTGAWTDKDNLSTIYQPAKLEVGGSIQTTIVSSQPGNNEDPRAGIIVRNDLSADGKGKAHGYALLVAGLNGSFFQTDSDNNGFIDKESAKVAEAATSTDTPLTIRLVRNSKTELEGFYQVPGTGVNGTEAEWKSIGKATLGEDAADKLDVGVFAVSNNGRGDYTAIFGNTTIAPKPAPTVTGIKVAAAPAKSEYTVGDTFAAAGLKVVKTLSDGTSADVDAADYSLSAVAADGSVVDLSKPFADAAVGSVTVTVALKSDASKTATFDVTVKAKPIVTTGIKVTAEPITVKYTVGQTFAADGLSVVKTQSNGIDVPLTADDYSLSAVAADGSVVDLAKPFADAAVGKVTVTVALKSDASKIATFELTVEKAPVTLASIEIAGKPSKTEYQVGEKFAADGLSVEKVMSDGTKVPAAGSEYTLTAVAKSGEVIDLTKPFAEAAIGTVTVTVNVDDKIATFELTVKAKPIVTTGIKVAAAPAKVEYTVGETFAAAGLKVVKTLSDGSSADVDDADYSLSAVAADGSVVDLTKPFADAAVGKITVTVALKSDASKTATFELTVKAKSDGGKPAPEHKVVALKVAAAPTKTKYTVGETFAAAGLKVVKVLDDGTEVALDAAGYTLTAVDAFGGVVDLSKPFAAEGKVTFTVTLNGSAADAVKPATFSVSVAKKADEGKKPAPAPKPAPTTPAKKPNKQSGLSDTGASVAGVAGVAALLLAAGAAVTLVRRRRG
ncbi:bacterial Ig-like domain-containing protein [Bifidobacterium jacchi]|uniref:Ig-like domain-containing protein n=1 Tax=Bifidobacterium jacchi TaxID=2490545 RepID=A0A5N5RNK7_9BIFI|nr:bacterial Ig-like domain-containing protein [Bifidobacterium jacchi]KAB5608550.1 hypothetical protein EHS19_00975 [Bifidobacterium jacchi]